MPRFSCRISPLSLVLAQTHPGRSRPASCSGAVSGTAQFYPFFSNGTTLTQSSSIYQGQGSGANGSFNQPALIQSTSTSGTDIATNATSASMAFPSNVTAKDMISAFVRWQANSGTSSVLSVTDTQGDTFVPAFPVQLDASGTNFNG